MGRMSSVNLVYPVCPVHLVQPNTRDRPNRPDRLDRPDKPNKLKTVLLQIPAAFDRLEQRHIVGVFDIHPDRNPISDTRDPGAKRFQLVC